MGAPPHTPGVPPLQLPWGASSHWVPWGVPSASSYSSSYHGHLPLPRPAWHHPATYQLPPPPPPPPSPPPPSLPPPSLSPPSTQLPPSPRSQAAPPLSPSSSASLQALLHEAEAAAGRARAEAFALRSSGGGVAAAQAAAQAAAAYGAYGTYGVAQGGVPVAHGMGGATPAYTPALGAADPFAEAARRGSWEPMPCGRHDGRHEQWDPDPLAAYCGVASRLQTAAAQAAPPQAPPVHAPMSAERLQQYIDDAQDAARRLSTLRATSSAAKHVPFSSAAGAALLGSIREVPQYASPAGGAQPRFTPSLGPGSCGYATNRTTVENDLRTIGTATRPETRPGSLATAATGFPASSHAQAIQTPQPARPSGAQPEAAASVGGASGGDHAVNQCPIRSAVDARLAERRGRHSH